MYPIGIKVVYYVYSLREYVHTIVYKMSVICANVLYLLLLINACLKMINYFLVVLFALYAYVNEQISRNKNISNYILPSL